MNVFEYALKMERDGEWYYREQAIKTQYEELKVVLEGMADDELRHYQIIQALQNRKTEYVPGPEEVKSKIQNVFEQAYNKPFISKDRIRSQSSEPSRSMSTGRHCSKKKKV